MHTEANGCDVDDDYEEKWWIDGEKLWNSWEGKYDEFWRILEKWMKSQWKFSNGAYIGVVKD